MNDRKPCKWCECLPGYTGATGWCSDDCRRKWHEDALGSHQETQTPDPSHPTPETPGSHIGVAGNEAHMVQLHNPKLVKLNGRHVAVFEVDGDDGFVRYSDYRKLEAETSEHTRELEEELATARAEEVEVKHISVPTGWYIEALERIDNLKKASEALEDTLISVTSEKSSLEKELEKVRQALFIAELDKNEARERVRSLEDTAERQRQRIFWHEEGEGEEGDLDDGDEDQPSDVEQMAVRIRELEAAIVKLVMERL